MTRLQQIFEEIQQTFPNVGFTQIKIDVNRVYLDFCNRTEILKTSYELTIDYDVVEYTLPTNCDKLLRVTYKDINDLLLENPITYMISDLGKIIFLSEYSEQITVIPSSIETITFEYVKIPTELTAESSVTELPAQFDEALAVGVLAKYYGRFPTTTMQTQQGTVPIIDKQMMQLMKSEYEKLVRKASRYTETMRTSPITTTKYYRYC